MSRARRLPPRWRGALRPRQTRLPPPPVPARPAPKPFGGTDIARGRAPFAPASTWPPQRCDRRQIAPRPRPEEHTSELQSLIRISYAVLCLKTKHLDMNLLHTQTPHLIIHAQVHHS